MSGAIVPASGAPGPAPGARKGPGVMHTTAAARSWLHLDLSYGLAEVEAIIGAGVLDSSPELLAPWRHGQLLIISDTAVGPHYAAPLCTRLAAAGYAARQLTIPPGDAAKQLATLEQLYAACQELRIERRDLVLAVGGGAVGDVAGMLAGTYLRGLDLVQVPTTLVGMITASIGGKVGINFRGAKNQIGMFKDPRLILADLNALATLPAAEIRSGLGELLTVGVLGAPAIVTHLERDGATDLPDLVAAAMRCKHALVTADPYDRLDIRARLNLGHTFGHALETLSGFTLPHGVAVGVGLHIAAQLGVALGLTSATLPARLARLLRSLGLPATLQGYRPAALMEAMRADKKRANGQIRWVIPRDIGAVTLVSEQEAPPGLVEAILQRSVYEGAI